MLLRSGADEGRNGASRRFGFFAMRVRAQSAYAAVVGFVLVASYVIATGIRGLDSPIGGLWSDLFQALPFIVLTHLVAHVVAGGMTHHPVAGTRALRVALANVAATALIFGVAVLTRMSGAEWAPLVPLTVILLGGALATMSMGTITRRRRFFSAS